MLFLERYKIQMRLVRKEAIERQQRWLKSQQVYRDLVHHPFPSTQISPKIPLNLFTCWHTKELPMYLREIHAERVEQNPEFQHFLFDEGDSMRFLEKHFDERVQRAYKRLIPDSYKSDLWRYCVLFVCGGMYVDIKFRCVNGFRYLQMAGEEQLWVRDLEKPNVLTGLMVSLPGNPVLKRAIDRVVWNVENEYYGEGTLDPTGPQLLGRCMDTPWDSLPSTFAVIQEESTEFHVCYILYKGIMVLFFDNTKYRQCQRKNEMRPHYGILWRQRQIYRPA